MDPQLLLRTVTTEGTQYPSVNPANVQQDVTDTSLEANRRTETVSLYTIFSPNTKGFILFMVSLASLLAPFGAATAFPALEVLADHFNVSTTMINLSITTYMVSKLRVDLFQNFTFYIVL